MSLFDVSGVLVFVVFCAGFAYYIAKGNDAKLNKKIGELQEQYKALLINKEGLDSTIQKLIGELEEANEKNKTVVSQKVSQAVRTGQIVEQMAPFLEQFPYEPRDCHFLGQPLDFIVFDLDAGKIVFLEIKSGKARESERQKKIKQIIKSGRVFYERLRVDTQGIKHTIEENLP